MVVGDPYQIKRARILREKQRFLRNYTTPSSQPNLYGVPHAIASYASGMGGIIAGGTALKFYSPNFHTSDVDIITNSNRHMFAQNLVHRLNSRYGERFRVIPGNRAVRVFDRIERRYVADVVNYPIRQEQVLKFENFNIVSPEHVFEGKIRNIMEHKSAMEHKIHRFMGSKPKKQVLIG